MPDIIEDDDIGADILAAMTELGGDSSPAPGSEAPAPDSGATHRADAEPNTGDTPARDERGRFAPKAKADGEQAEPIAKTANQAQDSALPDAGAQEPAHPAIQPPASLKAAVKAKWATLDPDVQQELVRIDKTVVDSRTEWSPKGERLNRFDELLTPVKDQLALRGTDEFRFLQGLIMADGMLRGENAEQALADIAAMYGLRPPPQPQPQVGPDGRPLQADPTIQTLQRQVADLATQLQARSQTDQQAQERQLVGEVQAFRTATNPDGSLKHLYFDNVRELMGTFLDSGRATELEGAYEMAIHADPEVRQLVLSAQPKPQIAPLQAKGLSVTGAPTQGGEHLSTAPTGSIEDDVRNAFREVADAV